MGRSQLSNPVKPVKTRVGGPIISLPSINQLESRFQKGVESSVLKRFTGVPRRKLEMRPCV